MDRVGSPLFPCSLPPPFYLAAISSASLLFLPVFFTTQQSIFLFYKISSIDTRALARPLLLYLLKKTPGDVTPEKDNKI
jgi:hypothetical protein